VRNKTGKKRGPYKTHLKEISSDIVPRRGRRTCSSNRRLGDSDYDGESPYGTDNDGEIKYATIKGDYENENCVVVKTKRKRGVPKKKPKGEVDNSSDTNPTKIPLPGDQHIFILLNLFKLCCYYCCCDSDKDE
jgi:hypothetical protein